MTRRPEWVPDEIRTIDVTRPEYAVAGEVPTGDGPSGSQAPDGRATDGGGAPPTGGLAGSRRSAFAAACPLAGAGTG
jgi:hypothetical protein